MWLVLISKEEPHIDCDFELNLMAMYAFPLVVETAANRMCKTETEIRPPEVWLWIKLDV